MGSEFSAGMRLPAIKPEREMVRPAVRVREVVAVGKVRLALGTNQWAMRSFYAGVLGLGFEGGDEMGLKFSFEGRQLILLRHWPPDGAAADSEQTAADGFPAYLGRVTFAIARFGEARRELAQRRISYEILHGATGLTREMVLRDPAGNLVWLQERRAF